MDVQMDVESRSDPSRSSEIPTPVFRSPPFSDPILAWVFGVSVIICI